MKWLILLFISCVNSQYSGGSPWNHRPPHGSPHGSPHGPGGSQNGPPPSHSKHTAQNDPIPQQFESYDHQTLPSKLPILAPNGVIEIYNRVIDDLIKRLEADFKKRALDPMDVVIRPTPPGPVRVPGHLQKRPFRRPGAALYRKEAVKGGRGLGLEGGIQANYRGVGKISFGEENSTTPAETTTPPIEKTHESSSSEELDTFLARSDEFFQSDDDEEDKLKGKEKKKKQSDTEEEEDDDPKPDVKPAVQTLVEKYQTKNTNSETKEKAKYTGGSNKKKPTSVPPPVVKHKKEEVDEEDDEEEMDVQSDDFELEPGTLQGGGDRPSGGYYPNGGPPAVPAKPNAQLIGLSRMKRSSDVAVSVDARSAVITARLLVGPLDVVINDSIEPQEKNIKATIPELEAEMLLMERHGVVFLQRFTLDRAYGQDVEISIPKSKSSQTSSKGSKGKGSNKKRLEPINPTGGFPIVNHPDPNHPSNVQQRFQTKMAAHISMEIVKLLRSGNLRVNLMRVAQGSMSKLKLPIVKRKEGGKKGTKKGEGKKAEKD